MTLSGGATEISSAEGAVDVVGWYGACFELWHRRARSDGLGDNSRLANVLDEVVVLFSPVAGGGRDLLGRQLKR